jgi:hypothetical protein
MKKTIEQISTHPQSFQGPASNSNVHSQPYQAHMSRSIKTQEARTIEILNAPRSNEIDLEHHEREQQGLEQLKRTNQQSWILAEEQMDPSSAPHETATGPGMVRLKLLFEYFSKQHQKFSVEKVKSLAKRFLRRIAASVIKLPLLKKASIRVITSVGLADRLKRSLYGTTQLTEGHVGGHNLLGAHASKTSLLTELNPRSALIYLDLRSAINQNKGAGK